MNHLSALIVGVIFLIGGIIFFQCSDKLSYDNRYMYGLFIFGYLFQSILEYMGYGDWYCFLGICKQSMDGFSIKVDDRINVENKANTKNIIKMDSTIEVMEGNENRESFIPSDGFLGKREGYVFKKGDHGMGYYLDD